MEALQCYASDSSSSDEESQARKKMKHTQASSSSDVVVDHHVLTSSQCPNGSALRLPPPPFDLLNASNSSCLWQMNNAHSGRVRSFPHVEGNFALHVYIPIPVSTTAKRHLERLLKSAFVNASELKPIEMELPSHPGHAAIPQESKLGKEYHMSLSRTVAIRVHQIDSVVAMLQRRLDGQKGYWMDLDQWDMFVNDEQTRCFLSLEVVGNGLSEICRQIDIVNEVFKLHNLPMYYKTPRPHVSIAWALGNITPCLRRVVEELNTPDSSTVEITGQAALWSHLVNKIECRIGNRTYCVWKAKVQAKVAL